MINAKSKMLQCFKWILLVALLQLIIHLITDYFQLGRVASGGEAESAYKFIIYVPYILSSLALWFGIGYIFDCKREASIGLGLSFALFGLNLYVFKRSLDGTYPMSFILIKQILFFIPHLTFGYLLFKDKRAWTVMLFAFVSNGIFLLSFGHGMMDFLNNFFRFIGLRDLLLYEISLGEGRTRYFYPLAAVLKSFGLPVIFYVFCHMIYALKNKHAYLSGRSIDLSNIYSKKLATVLYVLFRFTLITMIFGAIQYFGNSMIQRLNNQWELAFTATTIFVAFYLISLSYRNFLTEYTFARNRQPAWLYFAWNLPFFGLISWVISLFSLGDTIPLAERIQRYKKAQETNNGGIQFIIIALIILVYFDQLMRASSNASITMVLGLLMIITIVLTVWYFRHPSGLWVVIILAFLQILYLIFLADTKSVIANSSGFFINISNAIVFFSLFHMAYLKNEAQLPIVETEGDAAIENTIDPV